MQHTPKVCVPQGEFGPIFGCSSTMMWFGIHQVGNHLNVQLPSRFLVTSIMQVTNQRLEFQLRPCWPAPLKAHCSLKWQESSTEALESQYQVLETFSHLPTQCSCWISQKLPGSPRSINPRLYTPMPFNQFHPLSWLLHETPGLLIELSIFPFQGSYFLY